MAEHNWMNDTANLCSKTWAKCFMSRSDIEMKNNFVEEYLKNVNRRFKDKPQIKRTISMIKEMEEESYKAFAIINKVPKKEQTNQSQKRKLKKLNMSYKKKQRKERKAVSEETTEPFSSKSSNTLTNNYISMLFQNGQFQQVGNYLPMMPQFPDFPSNFISSTSKYKPFLIRIVKQNVFFLSILRCNPVLNRLTLFLHA
jgi:predicted ATP-dependent protease